MFGLMFGLNLLIIRSRVTNNRENERVMKFKIILTGRKKNWLVLKPREPPKFSLVKVFSFFTYVKQYCHRPWLL